MTKVVQDAQNNKKTAVSRGPPPPVPLKKVERPAPTKAERTKFKLFTNPNKPKLQTYNIDIRHFKTGPLEHWLETMDDLERVIQGSQVTTAEATFALARTILEEEALRLFTGGVKINGSDNLDAYCTCLNHVTTHIFPPQALARQKRYLRQNMRKPRDMTQTQQLPHAFSSVWRSCYPETSRRTCQHGQIQHSEECLVQENDGTGFRSCCSYSSRT
jgi:hypothetical protein